MLGWFAALWLAIAGPFGPELPPLDIVYLDGPGAGARPDTIAGLHPSTPDKAVAILFKGGFGLGGTAALTAALDAAPAVRLVAFDSPGGRPLVADGVAQVIRARHLDTTVDNAVCASACTIAYVAGTVRTAGPKARFGFHLGTGPFLADFAAKIVLQYERKWFVRGGASLSFADRALHAPNLEVYFAPPDELMAAGYVHRLLGPAKPPLQIAQSAAAAIGTIERRTSEAIARAQLERTARGGAIAQRSEEIAQQRVALVANRWFGRSSDTAVLAVVDAKLAALDWFAANDPVACMRWQIGRDDQDVAASLLPADAHRALLASQVRLLQDANAYPVPVPPDEDGSLAAADALVRRDLAGKFGPHALAEASTPEHGFDNPQRSCSVTTTYLRELRGSRDGARLLRWALAAG